MYTNLSGQQKCDRERVDSRERGNDKRRNVIANDYFHDSWWAATHEVFENNGNGTI